MAQNNETAAVPAEASADPAEKPLTRAVTDEETEQTLQVPAFAVNRFFLRLGVGGVRLTFAEQKSSDSAIHVRTAVMLPHQDAIILWKVLQGMMAPVDEAIQRATLDEKSESDG